MIPVADKMSDGVHFTMFPLWEDMNFTSDCEAYGNWYSTFVDLNSWDKSQYLDGDTRLVFEYFTKSLPPNWTWPAGENWTDADYVGKVLEWYGWNL